MDSTVLLIKYSALASPIIAVLFVAIAWIWYRRQWHSDQRWFEAVRHAHLYPMMIERLIRFRWIHQDCKYWIYRIRLDKGPIIVRGKPNPCLYWSLTYYEWTEVNASVSSARLELEPDGSYVITLAVDGVGPNTIPVRRSAKRGVLYLRIYKPTSHYPTHLPAVWQNGILLSEAYDA